MMATRWVLNHTSAGADVIHENPLEQCNLDDAKGREYVDRATAAAMVQRGQARVCGHCIGERGIERQTLDVQNHLGDIPGGGQPMEREIATEPEEPTSEPAPDAEDTEESEDEDESETADETAST